MTNSTLRAGILGAGYISDFHVEAISRIQNVQLVGVCDLNKQAAEKLASKAPKATVYTDLQVMLSEANLDVIHILTQPNSHFPLAKMAIEAGCHAVIEKPVTISAAEAKELSDFATAHGKTVSVNHNFVFSRPFNQLIDVIESGKLGPIKSVNVIWRKQLAQINFGPWDLWMLQKPENILFETGSHSLSELLAVIKTKPTIKKVDARLPKELPSGSVFYRRWDISAELDNTAINISTAFDQGYEQHSIEVEGMFGVAKADIENDVFVIDQPTGRAYDLERFHVNFRAGFARMKQAFITYGNYALSKISQSGKGNPYQTSMINGIENCYLHIINKSTRIESSIEYAIQIANTAEAIQAKMPEAPQVTSIPTIPKVSVTPEKEAEVLIIGASGFIGKRLLTSLLDQGVAVRALVRNASNLVGVELNENSEVIVGDYRNKEVAEKALQGVKTVYHLAVAHGNSLDGYLKADSEPTIAFAQQCIDHKIKRFIYTGTIDSLNLASNTALKERDGVDGNLKRRNNYAHSKAITEQKLTQLHHNNGLPLVIVRPAIVLGAGGPVNHVGVANWFGLGRCAFWGDGRNLIPAVLVDDIVQGLIKAKTADDIEGKTFNLSASSCISARDYVSEVEEILGSKITTTESKAWKHFIGDLFKWSIKVVARHPDKSRIPSVHDWKCREQHASFDTSAAQKYLDWQPTNDKESIVEKGIREPTRLFLNS